jgi:hypothetical protein
MAETRECVQCGDLFAPVREHARFCSPKCRVTWGRANAGAAAGEDALDWSIIAMAETTGRLLEAEWSGAHALVVITEAVWWVTMVDATLVRYYPDAYNAVLAAHGPASRLAIEDTFGGLRYVRNRMGFEADPEDFIEQAADLGAGPVPIAAWNWRPVQEPDVSCLAPRSQDWELTRYRAYQAQLAKRPVGDAFRLASDFLQLAAEGNGS